MPLTLLRHATQKPPMGPLKLDAGHPLAQGLVLALVINETGSQVINDAVGRNLLTKQGSPTWGSVAGSGLGLSTTTGGAGFQVAAPSSVAMQPPLTIVWKGVYIGGAAANAGIFGVTFTNSDTSPFLAYSLEWDNGTPSPRFAFNDGSFESVVPAISVAAGSSLWLAGVHTGSLQFFYQQDPYTANTAAGQKTLPISYGSPILYLGGVSYVSRTPAVFHEVAHIYNRALSSAELAWLKAEPYSMFQTRPLQRWFTIPGGVVALPPGAEIGVGGGDSSAIAAMMR